MSENEYQPQEGDVSLLEVRTDRFYVYVYEGEMWRYQITISQEEADRYVRSMQFMGKSQGQREYYRPLR